MKTGPALALGLMRLRKRLGITQAELAEQVGVHEQFISQLEREERTPSVRTLDALAEALGVTPWDLLRAGADAKAAPRAKDAVAGRIRAVIDAWPEGEHERLLEILGALGRVVAKAPKRKR